MRHSVTLLSAVLLATATLAEAQQPTKVRRIGVLWPPRHHLAWRPFGKVCATSATWKARTSPSKTPYPISTLTPFLAHSSSYIFLKAESSCSNSICSIPPSSL